MALVLGEEDMRRMRGIARNLVDQSESSGCVICDDGGNMLVKEGDISDDPLLLAALGAGVFAGSRKLAQILGEDDFSAIFHQGERKSILIRAVTEDVLLVVIFVKQEGAGMVKLYSAPAAERIRFLIEQSALNGEHRDDQERVFVLKDEEQIFRSNQ